MLVLDTDHLSALQRGGPQARQLEARLLAATGEEIAITIVSVEEQLRGWLSEIHGKRNPRSLIPAYEQLRKLVLFFNAWSVLPFDEMTATEYNRLQSLRLPRIGVKDLRIAAIVLSRKTTLLSANLRHFNLVPGLIVKDWLTE